MRENLQIQGRISKGKEWNWVFAWMWYWIESCKGARKGQGRMKSGATSCPEKFSYLLLYCMETQANLIQSCGSHRSERGWQVKARNLFLNTNGWVFWAGKGAWVAPWEQLVRQYWKKPWETPQLQSRVYPSVRRLSHITELMQIHAPGGLWVLWVAVVAQMTRTLVNLLWKMQVQWYLQSPARARAYGRGMSHWWNCHFHWSCCWK